jgi:uncharacterized protein YoaH (UPF0181 family)
MIMQPWCTRLPHVVRQHGIEQISKLLIHSISGGRADKETIVVFNVKFHSLHPV